MVRVKSCPARLLPTPKKLVVSVPESTVPVIVVVMISVAHAGSASAAAITAARQIPRKIEEAFPLGEGSTGLPLRSRKPNTETPRLDYGCRHNSFLVMRQRTLRETRSV